MATTNGSRLQYLMCTNDEPSSSEAMEIRTCYIQTSEVKVSGLNDQIGQAQAGVIQAQSEVTQAEAQGKALVDQVKAEAEALLAQAQAQADALVTRAQAQADALAAPKHAVKAQAQAVVDSLKQHAQGEELLLTQYRRTLAPIRRIPRDILIEIFLFVRELENEGPVVTGYRRYKYPFLGWRPHWITHVCSGWRRVALSVPMLWRTIKVSYRNEKHGEATNFHRLLTLLGRTGSSIPLDIAFEGPYDLRRMKDEPNPRPRVSLAWMGHYTHRIRNLSLGGFLCEVPPRSFDSLETLKLLHVSLPKNSAANMTSIAPLLRRVTFRGQLFRLNFVSWPQLTHLDLHLGDAYPVRRRVLLGVLSQCQNLVNLAVWCTMKDDDEMDDDEEFPAIGDEDIDAYEVVEGVDAELILLEHLSSLSVGVGSETYRLFTDLTLPALSELSINSATGNWSRSGFRAFLSHSSPPLRTLKLNGWDLPEIAFIDMLAHMHSLVDVTLRDGIRMTSAFAEALSWVGEDGTPVLSPNLERLSIYGTKASREERRDSLVSGEVLRVMLSSRDPSGEPAVSVAVSQSYLMDRVSVYRSGRPKRLSWDEDIQKIKRDECWPGSLVFNRNSDTCHFFF